MDPQGITRKTALLVDSHGELGGTLLCLLQEHDFEVRVVHSAFGALQMAAASCFDVVICDLKGLGLSRAAFQSALNSAQPSLSKRCLFVAVSPTFAGAEDAMLCLRPLNYGEILESALFLAGHFSLMAERATEPAWR